MKNMSKKNQNQVGGAQVRDFIILWMESNKREIDAFVNFFNNLKNEKNPSKIFHYVYKCTITRRHLQRV